MRKYLPILVAFLFLSASADAQTKPPPQPETVTGSAKAPLPQHESDLIAIFQNSQRQYIAARSADARKNTRMAMQSALHNFMGLSHSADDWVGVYRDSKKNPSGSMSVEIEIAPGVTIATRDNPPSDGTYNMLIKPFSAIAKTIGELRIGDEVVFSANVIGSAINSDEDMVLHPRLIAEFTKLKKIDADAPAH
jgi:hypothetical protein